ncbi:MAG: hypothetical protein U0W40_02375 [Acidimicrobiia bacterium]
MKGSTRIRKFAAATALAAVATVGVGATGMLGASAQTSAPPTAGEATTCHAQLLKLKARWVYLQGRIDVLQAKRDVAIRDGRWQAAADFQRQINDLQAKQAAVAVQIHDLEQQCG